MAGERTKRAGRDRRARVSDIADIAMSLPGVTLWDAEADNPIFQVGGKSFIFFRNPRPDALDETTGERLTDVIVFWVGTDDDKQAMVEDPATPFFTTPHFNGHRSVLLRASRIAELQLSELRELVEDAWLSRASKRAAKAWLASQPSQPG